MGKRIGAKATQGAGSKRRTSTKTTRRSESDEIQQKPGGRNTTKHRGSLAEMLFMIETARRGFGVAKPFGDCERYDVILDGGKRLWRVQVKGSGCEHHNGFTVRSCWRTAGEKRVSYAPAQIDFLIVGLSSQRTRGRRIWYVIPVRAIGGRLGIALRPFGTSRPCKGRFEKYREAWELLGPVEPLARGWSA